MLKANIKERGVVRLPFFSVIIDVIIAERNLQLSMTLSNY